MFAASGNWCRFFFFLLGCLLRPEMRQKEAAHGKEVQTEQRPSMRFCRRIALPSSLQIGE